MKTELLTHYLNSQKFLMKLDARLERLQIAELNPVERVSVFADCRDDVFTFLNLFATCYEPRLISNPDLPMFPFPHQQEIIYRCMDAEVNGHDLLIEKTRDMMATWTVLWYMLWRWRFQNRWYATVGTNKEENCDDNTPRSLYGKFRYMLYGLPQWMRPEGFRKSEHDLHLKLINPETQGYLQGESANPNFARGGRSSFIFMDEIFFWRFARESWRAAGDSSPCRVAVSTPVPSSFARSLRETMEANKTLLTLDWKMNPFKDEEWYKKEQERRSNDALSVQGELDINYQADPDGAYYPSVNNCSVRDFDYAPEMPILIGLDFGAGDKTAIVYFQRDMKGFYCLDGMEQNQRSLHWFLPFLLHGYTFENADEYTIKNKYTKEDYKLEKKMYTQDQLDLIKRFNTWRIPSMYCGELAHTNRTQTVNSQVPLSIANLLSGFGIYLRYNTMGNSHPARRTAVIRMLATTSFSSKYGALDVYDALSNSRFAPTRQNSAAENDDPVHDEYADLRAAFENAAVNQNLGTAKTRVISYHKPHYSPR